MRVAYVDMIGGAAGDMLLAAWIDAGLDAVALERALRTIVADGWELTTARVERRGIAATYVDLVIPGEDHHAHDARGGHVHGRARADRRLSDVLALVRASGLTPRQIERACAVYARLAEAEARVVGLTADAVAFHDVGQVDAILDVAATCVALDLLGIDELRCSAFPTGNRARPDHSRDHHRPSAETAEITRGFPQRSVDIGAELVTVTAAAILTTLVAVPGERGDFTVERAGYGAGRSEFPFPNVVRVEIGTAAGSPAIAASG